ncbi:MAG: response regulator [bacterium]
MDQIIKILVVDDDIDVARGTAHLLEKASYVIATAPNGVVALDTLATFQPQLVLTDRDMPAMDGIELCRRIKGNPALADVLVVIVSATYTESEHQSDGLDAGADGYIARPIANRELVARVEAFVRILRLKHILREKNDELRDAMANVKVLSGLLPICSGCKQIRDDKRYWRQVESYIMDHSEASFTHGICPKCMKKLNANMEIHELQMNPDQIRILIVDDDDDVLRGTTHLLTQAGYITATARNGVEALNVMPAFRPQLVLTDRDMPAMDGIELCRRIKGNSALPDVLVVIVSAVYTESEQQSDGLDAGADGYIARPVANRELAARVRAFARIIHLSNLLRQQTEELQARNDDLDRFNRLAVDRELRMIELKRELNKLYGRLGEPPCYVIAEDKAEDRESLVPK